MLSTADRPRLRKAISLALGLALAGITLTSQAKIQVLQSTYPDGTAAPAEIYLSGEITSSTTKEVTQALNRAGPKVPMLAFDSAGGDLVAAMELGDTLRRRGVNTSIGKYSGEYGKPLPGVCYSACVLCRLLQPKSMPEALARKWGREVLIVAGQVLPSTKNAFASGVWIWIGFMSSFLLRIVGWEWPFFVGHRQFESSGLSLLQRFCRQ